MLSDMERDDKMTHHDFPNKGEKCLIALAGAVLVMGLLRDCHTEDSRSPKTPVASTNRVGAIGINNLTSFSGKFSSLDYSDAVSHPHPTAMPHISPSVMLRKVKP